MANKTPAGDYPPTIKEPDINNTYFQNNVDTVKVTELEAKVKELEKEILAKTVDVIDAADAKEKVSDIKIFGNGDTFKLIAKASSEAEGWLKSTKALEIPDMGCIVQVTTQQGDNVAEALCFVPNCRVGRDENGNPKLLRIN